MDMTTRVLIADDDPDILELIHHAMEQEGFECSLASAGNEAWEMLNDETIDLAVLDIGLPEMSGIEIVRRMKKDERLKSVPVMFVTARTQEADVLIGFQVGADDYVRKPFSPKELRARVSTLLKRTGVEQDCYRLDGFEIHFDRHLVKINGSRVNLTQREFGVLHMLIKGNGRTASRNQLLERVWGMNAHSGPRSVDIVITRVREKIKPFGNCIRTIVGVGYQWDVEQPHQ